MLFSRFWLMRLSLTLAAHRCWYDLRDSTTRSGTKYLKSCYMASQKSIPETSTQVLRHTKYCSGIVKLNDTNNLRLTVTNLSTVMRGAWRWWLVCDCRKIRSRPAQLDELLRPNRCRDPCTSFPTRLHRIQMKHRACFLEIRSVRRRVRPQQVHFQCRSGGFCRSFDFAKLVQFLQLRWNSAMLETTIKQSNTNHLPYREFVRQWVQKEAYTRKHPGKLAKFGRIDNGGCTLRKSRRRDWHFGHSWLPKIMRMEQSESGDSPRSMKTLFGYFN